MPHRLEDVFAGRGGEHDYVRRIESLIAGGLFHVAEALLRADLDALDSDLGRLCLAMGPGSVDLSGWEELQDAIASFEGDPITAVALGMANDADLVFNPKGLYDPYLTLGLYTDESFCFSEADSFAMLAECERENPAWAGAEEDIEVYLELEGFAELNTALLRHKTQYFFPEDLNGAAVSPPLSYIEFIVAGWWRALKFHQLVKLKLDGHGLPGDIPVIAGIANMRQEVATVHYPAISLKVETAEVAELRMKAKPKKLDAIVDLTGSSVRQRLVEEAQAEAEAEAAAEATPIEEAPRGFFPRTFGSSFFKINVNRARIMALG
jgi:hypothetical protein